MIEARQAELETLYARLFGPSGGKGQTVNGQGHAGHR